MTVDTIRYAWAPITKTEKQPDGSLIVHGVAASPTADRDGQRMDPAWLATAFPEWYAESANVREQHDPKRPIGVGVGVAQDGDKYMLASRIVDPIAVAKADDSAGRPVLQGYSVGIKNPIISFGDPTAPNGTVVGGTICEVSLVDRPSNPDCVLELAKSDAAGDLQAVTDATVVQHTTLSYGEADIATARAIVTAVDELMAKADAPVDDESSQIATAQQAVALIAALIRGEAQGLADGNLNECWDISNLLDAVRALRYFIDSEQNEAVAAAEDAMSKADKPDTPAAPAAATTSETSTVDAGTEATVTKTDTIEGAVVAEQPVTVTLDELVKSDGFTTALSTAVTAALAPLAARLEKVETAPVPGGPVIARTAGDAASAREADAERLRAEATQLLAKADSAADGYVAQGYRERAADLLSKADA